MMTTDERTGLAIESYAISEQEMRVLFEEMGLPFSYYRIIYDPDGRAVNYTILAVNHAFELETGRLREEVVGKTALDVFPQTE